ncbi:MAG: cofactor assembly of complex C subunit B [Pseudanabaenaceae cyanobacterium]
MIRYLPLVVGFIGGMGLLVNRLTTAQLTTSQSRADALGVLLSAVLILIGLLWQQIQPKSPEAVTLIGKEQFLLQPDLPTSLQTELAWASHILLTNTVTKTLIVVYNGRILLQRGILPEGSPATDTTASKPNLEATQQPSASPLAVKPFSANLLAMDQPLPQGKIVERVLATQKPVYLVNMLLYPGRFEFSYLPSNTQGLIIQPISVTDDGSGKASGKLSAKGVMILGANMPRGYTKQDENWITAIADKLSYSLEIHDLPEQSS